MCDVLLVGYDFSHGKDSMVLLVGRKNQMTLWMSSMLSKGKKQKNYIIG